MIACKYETARSERQQHDGTLWDEQALLETSYGVVCTLSQDKRLDRRH